MSKSYNNYVALNASPKDMYGQIMSVSDELMWRYYDLISGLSIDEVGQLRVSVDDGANPRDLKRNLAHMIVSRFHTNKEADQAQHDFIEQFSKKQIPDDIKTLKLTAEQKSMPLAVLLREIGLVSSSSEGNRLIKQGAVKLNGEVISVLADLQSENVLQVGKRRMVKLVE